MVRYRFVSDSAEVDDDRTVELRLCSDGPSLEARDPCGRWETLLWFRNNGSILLNLCFNPDKVKGLRIEHNHIVVENLEAIK